MQSELENKCNVDQSRFWKSIGKIGIHNAKVDNIHVPMRWVHLDLHIDMLIKWKQDFSSLLNGNVQSSANEEIPSSASVRDQDVSFFEQNISILEIKKCYRGG